MEAQAIVAGLTQEPQAETVSQKPPAQDDYETRSTPTPVGEADVTMTDADKTSSN